MRVGYKTLPPARSAAMLIRTPKSELDAEDESRRRFLVDALSVGLLAGGVGWNNAAIAAWWGERPKKLPEGKSIFAMSGDVRVNGQPATLDTVIKPTDTITTGPGARLVGAVGSDALLLREKSELQLDIEEGARSLFRLVNGAMLSVFGKRRRSQRITLNTPVATIGIRGTGIYTESFADNTYLCTCYGTVEMASNTDPSQSEALTATYHDAPKFILKEPEVGKLITPAPFRNHTDLELMTLEALVGREVPFAINDDLYGGPRREY